MLSIPRSRNRCSIHNNQLECASPSLSLIENGPFQLGPSAPGMGMAHFRIKSLTSVFFGFDHVIVSPFHFLLVVSD